MTACGLKTEGPLFAVDRRSYEERRGAGGRGIVHCGWLVSLQAVVGLQLGLIKSPKHASLNPFGPKHTLHVDQCALI